MPFDSHTTRTRVSVATVRRDNNVRKIIAALRDGPMLRDELRDLLGNSRSGTNKYTHLLRADRVIEVERYIDPSPTSLGHPMFRLTREPGVVDAYLESLDANVARLSLDKPLITQKTPGLHQLADDVEHHCKRAPLAIPPHDPLMAAFYGMNRQSPGA
jgi:hypothetical protein